MGAARIGNRSGSRRMAFRRAFYRLLAQHGAAGRMSDFFMRLTGFMAISRVLRRHGVSLSVIGEIERETYKAQLLTVSDTDIGHLGQHDFEFVHHCLIPSISVKCARSLNIASARSRRWRIAASIAARCDS